MLILFDTEVAKEVGADAASIFQSIQSFVFYNESNEKNFFDGEYWMYDTSKAISKRFPYLNEQQVKRLIAKLVDSGFIKKGNYNKVPFDRTIWYSLTEKGKKFAEQSKVQNRTIESSEMNNGEFKNEQSESSEMNNQKVQNRPTNTNILPSNIPSNKHKYYTYGQYGWIKLTENEYNKLKDDFGDKLDKQIARIDEYIQSNGNKNKYKDWNLVIRKSFRDNWFGGNNGKRSEPDKPSRPKVIGGELVI